MPNNSFEKQHPVLFWVIIVAVAAFFLSTPSWVFILALFMLMAVPAIAIFLVYMLVKKPGNVSTRRRSWPRQTKQ